MTILDKVQRIAWGCQERESSVSYKWNVFHPNEALNFSNYLWPRVTWVKRVNNPNF